MLGEIERASLFSEALSILAFFFFFFYN